MLESYIELGFDHILDIEGYDHILFVIVLCVAFKPSNWKKMLVLITAFTIGHSLTLGLSALKIVSIDKDLVETLIPLTIIFSAALNIYESVKKQQFGALHYILALSFGLIHGLGFSSFFKSLVSPGESIVPHLFSFNIGVELGQIVVVVTMFLIAWVTINGFKFLSHKIFNISISGLAGLVALAMLVGLL